MDSEPTTPSQQQLGQGHLDFFHKLPEELIIKILVLLGARDILCCKAVCRRLRTIVDATVDVQYALELSTSGMEDVSDERHKDSSIFDRLCLIRDLQDSWKYPLNVRYRKDVNVPIAPGNIPSHDVYIGNILFRATGSRDESTQQFCYNRLECVCIHAARSHPEYNISFDQWSIAFPFDFISNFAADPSQDLLVLLEPVRTGADEGASTNLNQRRSFVVHCVSIKDGQPYVRNPITISAPYCSVDPVADIKGDVVGILVPHERAEDDRESNGAYGAESINIFNWRSEVLVATCQSCGKNKNRVVNPRAFTLISGSSFVVGVCLTEGDERFHAIEVYTFNKNNQSPSNPIHIATFEFCRLRPGVEPRPSLRFYYSCHGDYAKGSNRNLFAPSPSNVILVIDRINVVHTAAGRRDSFTLRLIFCVSTFLRSITTYHNTPWQGSEQERPALRFSWNDWGPSSARAARYLIPFSCPMYGSRLLDGGDILDFNTLAIARDLHKSGARILNSSTNTSVPHSGISHARNLSDMAKEEGTKVLPFPGRIIDTPTIIPHKGFYQHDLLLGLPYRRTPLAIDTGYWRVLGGCPWLAVDDDEYLPVVLEPGVSIQSEE